MFTICVLLFKRIPLVAQNMTANILLTLLISICLKLTHHARGSFQKGYLWWRKITLETPQTY